MKQPNNKLNWFSILLVFGVILFSCKQRPKNPAKTSQLQVVETKGYLVPKDSISPPIIIARKKPSIVPAIKNTLVTKPANVHPIDSARRHHKVTTQVFTPGKDGVLLPKNVPSTGKTIMAGLPRVVSANETKAADPNPNNLSSFNKLKGLNNELIRNLFEDTKGNLWIATRGGGITKYDGHYLTTFTQANGLCHNNITGISEDHNGNLWFTSWGGGLSKYDGKSFINFTTNEGLRSNYLRPVLVDNKNDVWICYWNTGISKYDGKSFTHFTKDTGLEGDDVTSMLEDKSGNLWFGVADVGLSKYDGTSFYNFTAEAGILTSWIKTMVEDANGTIWMGTQGNGLVQFDGNSFRFIREKDGLPNDFIYALETGDKGKLWLSTWKGGVTEYDGKSIINHPVLDGLRNTNVESILMDKSGNLWFGDDGGSLSRYNSRGFKHFNGDNDFKIENIKAITGDVQGNVYVGTYGSGVFKYDGQKFAQITEKSPGYGVLSTCILEDSSGSMWFGTWMNGVTKYDGKNFTHYPEMNEGDRDRIISMLEDTKGNIWFGTNFSGAIKFDGQNLPFEESRFTQFTVKEGLSGNIVTGIEEDNKGHLWFGTLGGGITKYDGDGFTHFTKKEGMTSDRILCTLKDLNGNLWFGTDIGGVSRYDGQFFTHFTTKEGLGSNRVKSILEDTRGNLWFSTDTGLSKLTFAKLSQLSNQDGNENSAGNNSIFSNYTYMEGFASIAPNIGKTLYQDYNGSIWVGTNDGVTVFQPNELRKDTVPPKMQLTNLSLFNETMHWRELFTKKDTSFILGNNVNIVNFQFDGVSKWHNIPENLGLRHKNNTLTFNYVGETLKSPHKIKYQYQLEGFEDNWNAPTSSHEATYGNLPWGDYTFKVKAMNGDGFLSDTLRYPFTIRPPWWHTWWAYLSYVFFFVGSFVALYRFQLHQKLKKAERLRLQELDSFKTRLYTNITHEFRTPLTVILGMARQVLENPKTHLKSGLNMIMRNGQNLLSLVNQMLDLSKLESGKLNLKYQQGDVVSFLSYLFESFDSLADDQGVQLQFESTTERLVMNFDPTRLQQIVSNLMSNAIKFTPKGGQVKMETSIKDKHFTFQIKDTGIGIAQADLPHIFDRFYQADDSHTRKGDGTGIGLALTRELVKLLDGSISVKCDLGRGAVFEVALPIRNNAPMYHSAEQNNPPFTNTDVEHPVLNGAAVASEMAKVEILELHNSTTKPLVLVADDNEDVRAYIASCLKQDYAIEIAKNGQECEEMANKITPDLILLDVMMPFRDGFEVCNTLKNDQRTSHIPVIILTAKADMESKLEGIGQGADAYLTKPFHKKELLLRIKNLLESRKKIQQYYRSLLDFELSKENATEVIQNLQSPKTISKVGQVTNLNQSLPLPNSLDNAFVVKVRRAIEERLDDTDFDVEQLCRAVTLSNSQVHRKLSALTGLSATHFIRYVRLVKAKELLMCSGFKITAIAMDCGFRDSAYFSRVFKKEFGTTPQKWREENSI